MARGPRYGIYNINENDERTRETEKISLARLFHTHNQTWAKHAAAAER